MPSNVTIVGAGIDKTVFQFTGLSQPVFRFINETSTKTSRAVLGSTTSLNQPKNSYLKGFSVQTGDPTVNGFLMPAVRDSVFEDIKIVGSYGDSGSNQSKAFQLEAVSSIVTCKRNKFEGIITDGMKWPVYSEYDITNNVFTSCEFRDAFQGFYLGDNTSGVVGKQYGPRYNIVQSCIFEDIDREGIIVKKGYGNRSASNTFRNVGNDGSGNSNNQVSIILFETHGNVSTGDTFDRRITSTQIVGTFEDLSTSYIGTETYITEVDGNVYQDMTTTSRCILSGNTFSPVQLFRIPVTSDCSIEITYLLRSAKGTAPQYNQVRRGTLNLVVDYLNIDSVQQHVRLVDDYEFVGEEFDDDNIIFSASISGADVIISYVNYNNLDRSVFEYKYKYISSFPGDLVIPIT